MSDWKFLNAHRARHPLFPNTDASWGFTGIFAFALPGEARQIRCIASDGIGWQHVSVSFVKNSKAPSWELMCRIKDLFWEDEDVVIQIHPAKSTYVNNHPGCLHLWRSLEAPQPLPPTVAVGQVGLTAQDVKKMTLPQLLRRRNLHIAPACRSFHGSGLPRLHL